MNAKRYRIIEGKLGDVMVMDSFGMDRQQAIRRRTIKRQLRRMGFAIPECISNDIKMLRMYRKSLLSNKL